MRTASVRDSLIVTSPGAPPLAFLTCLQCVTATSTTQASFASL